MPFMPFGTTFKQLVVLVYCKLPIQKIISDRQVMLGIRGRLEFSLGLTG